MKPLLLLFTLGLLLPVTLAAQADDPAVAQQQLDTLQQRIRVVEQGLKRQLAERDSAENELRAVELEAQQLRRKLAGSEAELKTARQRLSDLQAAADRQAAALTEERAMLAQQLRQAYVLGRDEWLRVLLSGDDPVVTGRQLVYYRYISAARSEAVAAVRESLADLQLARTAAADQAARLEALRQTQATQVRDLDKLQSERALVLARLDEKIGARQGEVAGLQQQASRLSELVAELTRALADLPVGDDGSFAARKGEMSWPVQGSALHRFGQRRAEGQLRWEGTLIGAPPGSEVKAVHRGRVVFADWLAGMGLLAVVDHGDGFMSLYAHNEDLLREVGDWVDIGEIIAHAGDSGGQAEAGLYFEIRRNGRPVDPRPWMKR